MRESLHYKLKEFEANDVYLSSADKERFTIIDNQISFLTDQIGDGVISGWDITSTGGTSVRVSYGLGIVDRFATETAGFYDFDLEDNSRWFFFVRRKPDVVADRSSFSQMAMLSYVDTTPPATPATPTVVSRTYNSITISWIANSEPDLDYYEVWRSQDGVDYGTQAISLSQTNSYTDEDVDQNTQYYYKLRSFDKNGLTNGSFSGVLNTSTTFDDRIPSDPVNADVINGDSSLQVLWDAGAFLVNSYRIVVQPVDTEGLPDGTPATYNVSNSTFFLILKELINGQIYQITIKSVSATGIESEGTVVRGQPVYTGGPREIDSFVYSDSAIDSSWNVAINLSWTIQGSEYNEYLADPAYYILTIQQGSEVGDPTIFLTNSVVLSRYTVNGVERKIHEKTKYTIKVQAVDADGNHSEGYLIRIKTTKFSPPGVITNFSVATNYTVTDKSVVATWVNTTTEFAYNEISVTRTTLGTSPVSTVIESNRNYGQATQYSIPKSKIQNQCSYTFTIRTYDSYGNVSSAAGGTAILNVNLGNSSVPGVGAITGARPPAPDGLSSISGNDMVTIYWNPVVSANLSSYRIWRADFTPGALVPSDFTAIATTNATKYTDYDVENGSAYYYFVTSVDIFNQESANPNDQFSSYVYVTGEPRSHSQLNKPPVINVSASGNTVTLTWSPDTESFDGYEIWRSINGKTSFKKIATVDPFSTEYVDSNALYLSGEYWYMIRKYRDEAEFIPSQTQLVPVGSLPLGYVQITNGTVTINQDAKIDLALLVDPIKAEVHKQFLDKTHLYYNVGDDRRVRLADDLLVQDWTTTDYKVYTTTTDIRSTGTYVAYVNSLQTAVSSVMDISSRTLTFQTALYDPIKNADQTAPTVQVVFLNTGEITGVLPPENIGTILADKISKGKILNDVLPHIDHYGRFHEPCLPTPVPATRRSVSIYDAVTPSGIAFYDFIILNDGRILAATPEGVRITLAEDGTQWDVVLTTDLPCTKLYYSQVYSWYIAIAGDSVYYSTDLDVWVLIPGIAANNVVRDIVEDGSGNIFVSCDGGVYYINPNLYVKVAWTQCPVIDSTNNAAYALAYSGNLYASLDSGIYESADEGQTWTLLRAMQGPIYQISFYAGNTFYVGGNRIFRLQGAVLKTLVEFPFGIRKLVIFGNSLYVTTDKGLYRSDSTQDFLTEDKVRFGLAYPSLQRNGIIPSVYSIKAVNGRFYMGLDERIYSASSTGALSLHANVQGICPTIFLNSNETNVGVYYGTSNAIVFDSRLTPTDQVSIVSSYTRFTALNGGWAETKYDAEIELVLNDVEQLMPLVSSTVNGQTVSTRAVVKPATDAVSVDAAVQLIVTPFFNARNSNFNDAFKYLTEIVQLVDKVDTQALLFPTTSVDSTVVAAIFKAVNLFKINLSADLAAAVVLPVIGGTATTANGVTFTYDSVSGSLTIKTGVSKYTRVALNIQGVGLTGTGSLSHKELDDAICEFDSGLPSSLAAVQQSNLLKLGIYTNWIDPLGRPSGYQSRFISPCDDSWYDRVASTINYTLELQQNLDGFSIKYPADILYLSDVGEVWVCGSGGIIAIDVLSHETSKVFASTFYVYNMSLSQGVVYALAEDGLYEINANTKAVTKNVDIDLPDGFTSVLQIANTTYIATQDGLLFRRPYEPQWTKLFDINNAFVRYGEQLIFTVGQDPNDAATSVVYYSHSGVVWNRSKQLTGVVVNGATQKGDSVYYATNQGLIVEDLGNLYSTADAVEAPTTIAVDLNGDDVPDEVTINGVDADENTTVAVTPDGKWYEMSGNSVINSGTSRLDTIHKVKVVNGEFWFFADNLIDIQSANNLIQLSTGKPLL